MSINGTGSAYKILLEMYIGLWKPNSRS